MSDQPLLDYRAPQTAIPPVAIPEPARRGEFYRLACLFGLVYLMQGVAQHTSLINQPIKYYFRVALGFNAETTAQHLAWLAFPWMLKPVYGLLSDFIPILGYRRKSYLLILNLLAAGGFVWLSGVRDPRLIVVVLVVAAVGVAATDVVVDALMIERGQAIGRVKDFQSVQWAFLYAALVFSGLLGGWLCHRLPPARAFATAALITACGPAAVWVATWFAVREDKRPLDLEHLRSTSRALLAAFRSRSIWAVIVILIVMEFASNISTVLYYHMPKLGFSEQFIGMTTAISAVGSVIGAVLFLTVLSRRFSIRTLLVLSIALAVVSKLAYVGLRGPGSAWPVFMVSGFCFVILRLTLLNFAAQACPTNAEGVTFAALMSASNLGMMLGDVASTGLYSRVSGQLWIVALTWAGVTVFTLALVPLAPGDREPARKAAAA